MSSSSAAPNLFSPLTIRGITLRNRIAVSPMCQYSSEDGKATDWHLVHLGSRAVGGAALVMVEATAVEARGRISPEDMGLWNDEQIAPLERIANFLSQQGAVPAMQLAHAGRKAGTAKPWSGGKPLDKHDGGWDVIGASALAFAPDYPVPHELTENEITKVVESFREATKRALACGFKIIEIHSAHGYLLHSFLSPLSNQRTDKYGGSFANRIRFLTEVVEASRNEMPESLPVFVRISSTDWVHGGWTIDEAVELAKELSQLGVDLIDCSSGGNVPHANIPLAPGYQVPFAEQIRKQVKILTGAVGMITSPEHANQIIQSQKADIVLLARQLLRDPYWPLHAAKELNLPITWPAQYLRAQ
jgi:2,4-dienoyl-CoA reductase-like NADH-dependent reductase (Old Yellow Enzyme family)